MSQVHHCFPGLDTAASRMGHGRDRCILTQTTLTVSQLTRNEHEISHLQSARRFKTTLVLLRVHGRIHSTRVFQNSYFKKYKEHQIRSSHGSRARKNETRTSYCSNARRDQARTSHCVREETKRLHAAPSARTKQKDQFARFDVRGRTLVLGRIYQAEWVRKPAIRNTTPIDNPARQNV